MFFLCFSVVAHLTEITPGSICNNSEDFGENQSTLELMFSKGGIFCLFFKVSKKMSLRTELDRIVAGSM